MNEANQWTPSFLKKLGIIKARAWSYTWIHRENSIYLNDIYDWASIVAYSCSFLAAVILIFPTNLIYIRILTIMLSFGSGLLVFYMNNKDLKEAAQKHKMASSRFSSIYNNIERQEELRNENPLSYHNWITQQFDTLYGTAPDIDPPIIEEYIRKFARKRKVNPIEAAEFDEMEEDEKEDKSSNKNKTKPRQRENSLVLPQEVVFLRENAKFKKTYNDSEIDLEKGIDETNINHPTNNQINSQANLSINSPADSPANLSANSEENNIMNHTAVSSDVPSDLPSDFPSDISSDSDESDISSDSTGYYEWASDSVSESNDEQPAYDSKIIQELKHKSSATSNEKKKNRHIDYELKRLDMSSNLNNIGISSRCFIPEYELDPTLHK